MDVFKKTIREDTILASIMHVNNEIGVIQDLQAIGDICRENKVFFHVDAAQSVGKLEINLESLPVDLMSFSAHKIYGPKGMGALYVSRKPRVRLEAQMHGGGHERGMRSGTLATHQIVGIGEAFAIAKAEMKDEGITFSVFTNVLLAQDMEEVVVTSSLVDSSEITNPLYVIDGDDINDDATTSLGEAIDSYLGVSIADYGSAVGQPIIRVWDAIQLKKMLMMQLHWFVKKFKN